MNINCPHCTAYLTVPEQYSGQLMKCPKCNSNFTVPALPAVDQEPAFAMAPPAPPPAPSAPPPPAPPMAPPIPFAPDVPAFQLAPPEPAFNHSPAPAPPPSAPATPPRPAPTPPPKAATPSAPPSTGAHVHHLPISKGVLQWIPVAAAVLIFVLQLFPWVGVYPGGVPVVTQSAWGAAFGDAGTADADLKKMFTVVPEADGKAVAETLSPTLRIAEPKASLLLIFYLLPFFIITLLVSIAVAVLPFLHIQLPPAVANLLPWKWGILAILNAVLLLFLVLQLLLNFGIETSVKESARAKADALVRNGEVSNPKDKPEALDTKQQKTFEALKGSYVDWLDRTAWLYLVLALHVLATVAAATLYWMEKNGVTHAQFEAGVRW